MLDLVVEGVFGLTGRDTIEPKIPQKSVDDLAVVMYTSGTSGLPKGAMLTYGNLHYDTIHSIEAIKLTHDHTFLGVIPLFHAFGMSKEEFFLEVCEKIIIQLELSPQRSI